MDGALLQGSRAATVCSQGAAVGIDRGTESVPPYMVSLHSDRSGVVDRVRGREVVRQLTPGTIQLEAFDNLDPVALRRADQPAIVTV